eukprot:SAG31_NODE_292_length_18283_cov_10.859859_15_plen_90_part_00
MLFFELRFVSNCSHDIELDDVIKPDPELRAMLQRIDLTKCSPWIYTASVDFHAQRCIECLKIDDALPNKQIIDVKAVGCESSRMESGGG